MFYTASPRCTGYREPGLPFTKSKYAMPRKIDKVMSLGGIISISFNTCLHYGYNWSLPLQVKFESISRWFETQSHPLWRHWNDPRFCRWGEFSAQKAVELVDQTDHSWVKLDGLTHSKTRVNIWPVIECVKCQLSAARKLSKKVLSYGVHLYGVTARCTWASLMEKYTEKKTCLF